MSRRRRPGERELPNVLTGNTRMPQPSLQPPQPRCIRNIDWSKSSEELLKVPTRTIYVPLLPEDREEFEMANSEYIHDGRGDSGWDRGKSTMLSSQMYL